MFGDSKTLLRILALFLSVLSISAVALWLSWRALGEEGRSNQDFALKIRLLQDVHDVRTQAADMYSWQTAYAFQIRRGMPDATSDDSPLRRIYLDTWKILQLKLAALPYEQLTPTEKNDLDSAWRLLREYADLERKVIAGYRQGAPADVAQATERVMYAELTLFQQISYSLTNLSASVLERSNEASISAAKASEDARRLLAGLGVALLALILLLAFTVARFMAKSTKLVHQLEALARTDALTGVANRREWDTQLVQALQTAASKTEPLCVALVDLDHFKRFNDTHGHQAGDELLRKLAKLLEKELLPNGSVARYGGEEFALLLRGSTCEQARALLDRLRAAMPDGQTFSAGLMQCNGAEDAAQLLAQVDLALYRAKANGRNCVEAAAAAPQSAAAPEPVHS